MISVFPDAGKNRLVLTLKGRPDAAELQAATAEVRSALARLHPPFDLLSDVRELESLENMSLSEVTAVVRTIVNAGVRRTVRVVGKSPAGAVHMERVARALGGHHAALAFSLEEAEQVFSSR